jgi:hypothetical protein
MATIPPEWLDRAVTTKGGVKYWISDQGYREKWAQDASQTTIVARVPLGSTTQFLRDMLGYSYLSGGTLKRVLPEYNPFNRYQWCTACDLVAADGNPGPSAVSKWILFDWYAYQCSFTSPLNEYVEDDDVGSETVDGTTYAKEWLRSTIVRPRFSGKNQIIPGNSFETDGTLQSIGQTTTLLTTETRYEVTWIEVPLSQTIITNIRSGLGKINKTDFAIQTGDVWKASTVLFEDFEFTPRRTPRGDLTSDLKFVFRRKGKGKNQAGSEIDVTWQMFPLPNRRYIGLHIKSEPGDKPYEEYEFRKLFSFA